MEQIQIVEIDTNGSIYISSRPVSQVDSIIVPVSLCLCLFPMSVSLAVYMSVSLSVSVFLSVSMTVSVTVSVSMFIFLYICFFADPFCLCSYVLIGVCRFFIILHNIPFCWVLNIF